MYDEKTLEKLAAKTVEARFEYFVPRFAKHAAQLGIRFETDEELVKAAMVADALLQNGAKPRVEKTASQGTVPYVYDEFDKEAAEGLASLVEAVADGSFA